MKRSNCFVCIIRPVFLICRFTAFAANCSCLHCRPPSRPYFYKSRFLFVCALIASIFLTARACAAVATLSNTHINEIWLPLANIVITSTATHMIITSLVNLDLQIKHVHGLLSVISNKRSYAVEEFTGSRFQKTVCLMCCQKYAPIVVLTFLIVGQQLYKHITLSLVLTVISLLINISAGLSTFLFFLLVIEIYYWLFGKCHRQIKTVLCQHHTQKPLLLEKLRKAQKLQLVLFQNFQMVQEIYNVSLLVYWFCGCSVSVLNFFLLVHAFEEDRRPTDDELLLFAECIFACFGACTTIAKIEKLRDMNEDLLSFLYRYPISNLTPVEAAQVEMIITTLELQKPQLKACGLFAVSKSMLAAVVGTIIKYLLVTVQFHPPWSETFATKE